MLQPGGGTYLAAAIVLACVATTPLMAANQYCTSAPSSSLGTKTPVPDADLTDWCLGALSNTAEGGGRIEDCSARLECGVCTGPYGPSCETDADCFGDTTCDLGASHGETVWWDDRTDAAVNDLAALAMAEDSENLYIAMKLWIDPDPTLLLFLEVAIDSGPGGVNVWHDPQQALTNPGHCSESVDRACTGDVDCHFCAISTEPAPSTRPRTCGSGCDIDVVEDICDTSQVCVGVGTAGSTDDVGVFADPSVAPDYIVAFDFGAWLVGVDGVLLMEPGATIFPDSPWDPVTGCEPDWVGDVDWCDFSPMLNPGVGSGAGGPPGTMEIAIPWNAFPDLGPGQPIRFTALVARGLLTLDYTPRGAIEDVFSERVAGRATTSPDACTDFGIGNVTCEIADASTDAFVPAPAVPGGRAGRLEIEREGIGPTPSLTLTWEPSCSGADTDYAVYEGRLGIWYGHAPVGGTSCSTAGVTSATFQAGAENSYYLVVPTSGSSEGSYGLDGDGAERPASLTACAGQSLGTCP